MLPTKGYFQDIECPFFNDCCGRPYCHFRHRRKLNESDEDSGIELASSASNTVPTYKPTPKSELANIQNKSHIPISYVPDLALNSQRTRTLPRIEKPTYKPTPLSILSSANKLRQQNSDKDNNEIETENNIYDPITSSISYDTLLTESTVEDAVTSPSSPQQLVNENLIKIESDIEKEQTKLELLKSGISDTDSVLTDIVCKKDDIKISKSCSSKPIEHNNLHSKDKHTEKKSKNSESVLKKKNNKESHHKTQSKERVKENERENKKHKSVKNSKEKNKTDKDDKKQISKSKSDTDRNKQKEKESKREKDKGHRSRSQNRTKEKKHSKSRSRSRHRSRNRHKAKQKDKDSRKQNSKIHEKESKSKGSTKITDSDGEDLTCDDVQTSPLILSDVDLEDENDTLEECYKIFNEYIPTPKEELKTETPCPKKDTNDKYIQQTKQRIAHGGAQNSIISSTSSISKVKKFQTPGQTLENRYKIAKLAQANREQEAIINEVKNITPQIKPVPSVKSIKRPPSILEMGRLNKLRKKQEQNDIKPSSNVVDDIINGLHQPTIASVKISPIKLVSRKIAAVSNVALIQKAKERISIIKSQQNLPQIKTVAHVQKGNRIAHVPEYSLADIPDVLQADKSKLPVNVRTRFLSMMADECLKLYELRDEAYNRALNEEYLCYEKCKVLTIYRNSAMLAVNRLRKEIQERESKGLGLILAGENSSTKKDSNLKGWQFYQRVKKWILTEEELDANGYPKESEQRGIAKINNCKKIDFSISDNDSWRTCVRCSKKYQVGKDGWQLIDEDCTYHPLKKRTLNGIQVHLCCKASGDIGCVTSDWHVSDGTERQLVEGYQTTLPAEMENDPRSLAIYALDCEMCYTTKGLELTRITIVDTDCKTVYESLVKPLNAIVDYNTRFSGITKDQMDRTSTSILQVQANILHLCNAQTILVGHSLESDLKALKIIHRTIIDTAVLFPHRMGLPHKRALKSLATEYLKKIIQNDTGGHDSAEDAITCMELIKWKLKEELKVSGGGR